MKKITEINVENKKVIVRVDYNVPIKDGIITDNNRIIESLKTIKYLLDKNSKIILMSHLGKIKTIEDKEKNSLYIVKKELEKQLKMEIKFCEQLKGKKLEEEVNNLKPKEILLLENTRYMDLDNEQESKCDEELSEYWASLADVFILDAFGSAHRAHASTYGISKYLPHAIGFLIEKEITELDKLKKEEKIILLGGAKVSDKLGVIENLMPTTEVFLIGGAMCASFLKCLGHNVGKTYVDTDKTESLKKLLKTNKIILPLDVKTENGIKDIENINDNESILDIGPKTIELFKSKIDKTKTILLNGTMGKYEEKEYENGTKSMFEYLKNKEYKVIVCGGDTVSASKKYNFKAYYTSTGGGASLEYLEGKELKPLKIMEEEGQIEQPQDTKIIVLNHKSYLNYDEIEDYYKYIETKNIKNISLVIMPNIAYLSIFKNTKHELGSQNFYSYNCGAYTGETSLEILKSLNVKYTLIGHPDRIKQRLDYYETIKDKLFKSLNSGFNTILCVAHDEREHTLKKELKYYLKGIEIKCLKNLIISYEPINKIESNNVDINNIEKITISIKKFFEKNYDLIPKVIYGGGITKDNIKEVIKITDGVLLGKNSADKKVLEEILKSLEN